MNVVPAVIGGGSAAAGYITKILYGNYRKNHEEEELKCKEKCKRLIEEIKEKMRKENSTFRFLFFGITQHGKSTLCNGILSAYEERENLADFFQAGSGGNTYTKGFCPCKLDENVWLIDMGGIFESDVLDTENIKHIVEGKVPFYKQLGEYLESLDPDLKFPEPESNDLACVVIVLKPYTVITEQLRKKFQAVDDCAARGLISRCLVVTHIEEVDPDFEEPRNLICIEDSPKISECRQRMSEETGVPLTSITFVRNYWNKPKTDVYTNYIMLEFFKQLMLSSIDAKRRGANREELRNK